MANQDFLQNTFEGGLNTDAHISAQPNNSYPFALNLINRDLEQTTFVSNEHSNRKCGDVPGEIVGATYIDEENKTLFFTKAGELYLVHHETCETEFVASDTEFGCDWGFASCEWVYAEIKIMQPCSEIHAYWSSDCTYYTVNISEMLDRTRKEALKSSIKEEKKQCSDKTCDYFKLFNCTCAPKINPISYDNGGELVNGAYQFVAKLSDRDGSDTNWFNLSDPVYIGSPTNVAGERANGSIDITVSGLDCRYDKVDLAVIKTIGGVVTAEFLTTLNYNQEQVSYTYYGNEGSPIELQELLIKRNTYIQGRDLLQKDGQLYLYNTKQIRNLDYQRRANEINTQWVEYEFTYEETQRRNIKSFMRGETYAFGIVWNYCDGTHTPVFHIPAKGDSSNTTNESGGTAAIQAAQEWQINQPQGQEFAYDRRREEKPDSVAEPQKDEYVDSVQEQLNSYVTDLQDLCETIANCEECAKAGEVCEQDRDKIDTIINDHGDVLSEFIELDTQGGEDITADLSKSSSIKEAASKIIDAIKKRERIFKKKKNVQTPADSDSKDYGQETSSSVDSYPFGDQFADVNGNYLISELPNIVASGTTFARFEENIVYPDTKNCEGELIYGGLAGTPVAHHTFPRTHRRPHYVSKSSGVPSRITPNADEYSDGYTRPMGVAFDNIQFPTEEELSKPLCPNNPYTIVAVKRTRANKTVLAKGLGTNTYIAENNGKEYVYPRHAVNSFETVDRHIDMSGGEPIPIRGIQNPTQHESFIFHSLDTNTRISALNFDDVYPELQLNGTGYRHGLYEEGRKPDNSLFGSRIDQKGTRQAINLNKYITAAFTGAIPANGKIYAQANRVMSPPNGMNDRRPLMNKYREGSVWIGAQLPSLIGSTSADSDASFVGDVLDHDAPIHQAAGQYVTLFRDLPNQYGDLTGLVYHPILQAPKGNNSSIQGLGGDIYIGPYSFKRTSYISDKVGSCAEGEKFQISNMVPGKKDRCVCDPPDDIVIAENGLWVHTELPKDQDAANPKNWAGLHTIGTAFGTPGGTESRLWQDAKDLTQPESDMYFPQVLKTLVTYWGEFEVCPWKRQRGEIAAGQVYYPNLDTMYIDSDAPDNHPWEESYINRFYAEVEQPSLWAKTRKALVKSLLNIGMAILGVDNLFDIQSAPDLVANWVEFPMLLALWMMLVFVLFTNAKLDQLLGIPECTSDDQGNSNDYQIKQFEDNYFEYNEDYSLTNSYYQYYGMTDPYITCDCDDCDDFTTNDIYYSNKQVLNSPVDAYKNFRSNNYLTIPANAGRLRKLFSLGNEFFAHTTDAIWKLQYQNTTIASNTGLILVGKGDLLAEPQAMLEDTPEGFAGLKYTNNAINSQYGYFFVDDDARKIYQFSQGGLEEISNKGMFNFFKEYLAFCNAGSCIDEKVPNTSYHSLGVDPRLQRFLITKSDGDGSWTLSYDLATQQWISFHSYIPQAYIWDRDHMYSIKNGFWKHDDNSSFTTFYGEKYPFIVQPVATSPLAFEYQNTLLATEAREVNGEDWIYNRDITFDQLAVWNSWQTSGLLNLDTRADSDCSEEDAIDKARDRVDNIEVVKEHGGWRINEIRDYTADHRSPILSKNKCNPLQELGNVNKCQHINNQEFKNSIIKDDYMVHKFILNRNDIKLYTKALYTNKSNKQR